MNAKVNLLLIVRLITNECMSLFVIGCEFDDERGQEVSLFLSD